jgi:6-phosphogluconolactonase
MSQEVVVGAEDVVAVQFVRRFEAEARRAMTARGRLACALSGGSVARAFFPALAGASVDWARVELFWCDERAVPPTDPESNYGLASRLWLQQVCPDPSRVHRMPADDPDLEAAADRYAAEMVRILGDPPSLSVILLGMGQDGHVCSLFPGHPALDEGSRSVVAVRDAPVPPRRRLTITRRVLAAAQTIYVVAFGVEKAPAIREAVEREDSALPVSLAVRSGPQVVFMLDPGAASLLTHHRT